MWLQAIQYKFRTSITLIAGQVLPKLGEKMNIQQFLFLIERIVQIDGG